MGSFWYYLCAVLFVLLNVCALASDLFVLPGNWFIVGLTLLFVLFIHSESGNGIGWPTFAIVLVLALLGEVVELVAGAAGAAKSGGSRRGMLLAMVGAMAGSMAGGLGGVFIPIPLLGPVIGAVGGGALGAFAGAYAGEAWKGRGEEERLTISRGALVGRLLGTVGKLGIGAVMVAVTTIAAFVK